MKLQDRPHRVWKTVRRMAAGCVLALPAVLCGPGCREHRISFEQFLAMQQALGQAPTTQPAPKVAVDQAQLEKLLGPYRIGRADVISVTVTPMGDRTPIGARARVRRDGTVDLPLAGAVKVADMEMEDVEEAIKKRYVEKVFKDATVHATLDETALTPVLVTGAVSSPGLVQLRRTERNVLFAVAAARGYNLWGLETVRVRRLRDPEKKIELDLTDPEQVKTALALPPLETGDVVTVAAATPNTVYLGGLVKGPGPQAYPPGVRISVLQALAAAGGLRTDVFPKQATLIRRMPDGKDVQVKLDLDDLAVGKDPNIALAAGDILWVPHTFATRVQEWINQHISIGAGASANASYSHSAYWAKNVSSGGAPSSLLIGTPVGGGGGQAAP